MAYYRGLNSNIRCIEIKWISKTKSCRSVLNSNIRCIEIKTGGSSRGRPVPLNSNIRCIEITKGINISNKHTVE